MMQTFLHDVRVNPPLQSRLLSSDLQPRCLSALTII